ncbi:MAG: tetratricopeptide repeat protein [Verrucomicrobia bacterium]|nr:tetratricopeptide repeat protein [Verrucomicrobiota bacterium]
MPEKNDNEVSRQAREYYDKGRTAFERNMLDAAIHYLMEAVIWEPGFLKARQLLRISQIRKFKNSGIMSRIFAPVKGSPALTKAMTNLKKDPVKAMEAAEKALSSNPYSMQSLRILSEAAATMDLPLTAVFAYETAREASPDDIGILLALGRLYQASGQADKGRECYERVLELDPASNEGFKGLKDATANEAMTKGKWESSESYRDMIKDKKEAKTLEDAQRIFKDEDVVRSQMEEIYKQAEQQPENVSLWKKLGDLALQINEFDHAFQYYQHAFEITKGADGNLEKAMSETKLRKLGYAIRQKEETLNAEPSNEKLQQEIAVLKQEREAATLQECENRVRRYPNDLDYRYELARAYLRNNMVDKAIPEFQMAAGNPKNKIVCTHWLGKCFRDKGMADLAIQRFKLAAEQAVVMDNTKKEILYDLGITHEQMGKKEDAIEQFKIIYEVDVNFRDVAKKIEAYYREQAGTSPQTKSP